MLDVHVEMQHDAHYMKDFDMSNGSSLQKRARGPRECSHLTSRSNSLDGFEYPVPKLSMRPVYLPDMVPIDPSLLTNFFAQGFELTFVGQLAGAGWNVDIFNFNFGPSGAYETIT